MTYSIRVRTYRVALWLSFALLLMSSSCEKDPPEPPCMDNGLPCVTTTGENMLACYINETKLHGVLCRCWSASLFIQSDPPYVVSETVFDDYKQHHEFMLRLQMLRVGTIPLFQFKRAINTCKNTSNIANVTNIECASGGIPSTWFPPGNSWSKLCWA